MHNVIKVCEWATEMLNKVGIELGPVPLKVLKPILDGAALEEDEEIQELWAALLANAGGGAEPGTVSPAYPAILRQLSPNDAKVMRALFEIAKTKASPERELGGTIELHLEHFPAYTDLEFMDIMASLHHHSLIERHEFVTETASTKIGEHTFRIIHFGGRFIRACEPPKRSDLRTHR